MLRIYKLIIGIIVFILIVTIVVGISPDDALDEYPEGEVIEVSAKVIDKTPQYSPPEEDIVAIARTLYGECRGVESDLEKSAVAWVILNRIDAGYSDEVIEVVSAPSQFVGYDENHPVDDDLYELAKDVLMRWHSEKSGALDVGRTLPPEYLWFTGDGVHNYFRNEFDSDEYWEWYWENPYID